MKFSLFEFSAVAPMNDKDLQNKFALPTLPLATISMSPIYSKKKKLYLKWYRKTSRQFKKKYSSYIPNTWNSLKIIMSTIFNNMQIQNFNEGGERFLYTF